MVSLEPCLLQAEQPQLSQPFFPGEGFQLSDHFCGHASLFHKRKVIFECIICEYCGNHTSTLEVAVAYKITFFRSCGVL